MPTTLDVLDLAVLDKEVAIKLVSGNEKLADDLLQILIKEFPDYIQSIQTEYRNKNKEALRDIIHKIHGGLRYVSTPALIDIISKTDTQMFQLDDEQLKQNILQIYQEIERVLEQGHYS